MTRLTGWVIVNRKTGVPVLISGHMPCYWLKKVAASVVKDVGMEREVTIKRVVLQIED